MGRFTTEERTRQNHDGTCERGGADGEGKGCVGKATI